MRKNKKKYSINKYVIGKQNSTFKYYANYLSQGIIKYIKRRK